MNIQSCITEDDGKYDVVELKIELANSTFHFSEIPILIPVT